MLLAGKALVAIPIIAPHGDRLIGVLLILTMEPARLTEATERTLRFFGREMAQAMSRDRVVVNFQRERQASRAMHQPSEEAGAREGRGLVSDQSESA